MATPTTETGTTETGGLRGRLGVTYFEIVVAAVVGISTVVWLPVFIVNTVPRNAAAIALLPLGLALTVVAAFRRDLAATAALLCIGLFIVSAGFAESPRVAFVGQMPEWASVVALSTSLAWWAVGREFSTKGCDLVVGVLTAGALFNGGFGVAQLFVGVERNELFASPGRASGLMFNPVFYGSFMVGVAAIWVAKSAQRATPTRLGLVVALSFMAALSGGRVVLIACGVALAVCIVIWRRSALFPAAMALIGVVVSDLVVRLSSVGQSTSERVSAGGSIASRIDVWQLALQSVRQRPLLGWGPSNAELAVMRQVDVEFAQVYSADGPPGVWWDPHNFLLFLLVSVGVVGTLAMIVFVVLALRGSIYWPPLVGALAIVATWSLQPATVHTLPLAFLLLGMAVRSAPDGATDDGGGCRQTEAETSRPPHPAWQRWALGLGGAVGLSMLLAAFVVDRSAEAGKPDRAASVSVVFGGDPWLDLHLSEAYQLAYASDSDPDQLVESMRLAERAASSYPTSQHYQAAADAAVAADEIDNARRLLTAAIRLEPWDPLAHYRRLLIAQQFGEVEVAEAEVLVLCRIGTHWCDLADRVVSRDPDS